jgi:hypothetical protein
LASHIPKTPSYSTVSINNVLGLLK